LLQRFRTTDMANTCVLTYIADELLVEQLKVFCVYYNANNYSNSFEISLPSAIENFIKQDQRVFFKKWIFYRTR